MNTTTLPVSEVYGPVLQGEGPHMGRPVSFLRLGLCNLACSWCDTPYTWDRARYDLAAECPPRTAAWILDRLPDASALVLSGGEPLMHRANPALQDVVDAWPRDTHVETNGTLSPPQWMARKVAWWSVSPKLSHSGDREAKRIKPAVLELFAALAAERLAGFKFVATGPQDLAEVDELVATFDIPPGAVWVMPEGVTLDAQLAGLLALEPHVLDRGWNLAPRLHVLMHGNQRGI